jgi:hypothetical protein
MKAIKKIIFLFIFLTIHLESNFWFQVAPLEKILNDHTEIEYIRCFDQTLFEYKPFPLSINLANHPHVGSINSNFILKIPHATVQSQYGEVLVDNTYIQEMIWKNNWGILQNICQHSKNEIIKVPGRVAVITQFPFYNYFHWLTEILARLALLELQNISYDWLYVPQDSNYMKSSLDLWGIDQSKIISPDKSAIFTADEIILPSLVSNMSFGNALCAAYVHPELLRYVRNKLLLAAQKKYSHLSFSKKVFISRKDAPIRKIINEDEIFTEFEKYGFVRYELTKLSAQEQIILFHTAEIIVTPQGTSSTNTIFCTPETKIIELFQGLNDCTFWYIAQILNLNYTPIATTEFACDYFQGWQSDTYMPPSIIQKVMEYL